MHKPLLILSLFLPLALAGCASGSGAATDRATAPAGPADKSPPPSLAELPDLRVEDTRTIPVLVGVEQYGPRISKRGIIPELRPIEPTPRERAILAGGEEKKPEFDEMVFYQPPRSAEDGVYPFDAQVTYGTIYEIRTVGGRNLDTTQVGGVGFTEWGSGRPTISAFDRRVGGVSTYQPDRRLINNDLGGTYGISEAAYKAGRAPTRDP